MSDLGGFERQVYEQMIEEYPAMADSSRRYTDEKSGIAYTNSEQLTYFIANAMWDAFDEALDYVTNKGEEDGSS